MDRHNLGKNMTQEDQETLNEIFLGKEDPDMAFKRNHRTEEDIKELRVTTTIPKYIKNGHGKLTVSVDYKDNKSATFTVNNYSEIWPRLERQLKEGRSL